MKNFGEYKTGEIKVLQDICADLNCTGAIDDSDGITIAVEAPKGYVFTSCLLHEMKEHMHSGGINLVAIEMISRLEMATEKCEEPDCEWCN